ncbi:hypothetical protein [Enterobacter bugandensis]|uniref:hypothetical protein n=1 Tax=Enterobacter bugandensis TaxID=881260 RepID=UPI001FFD35BE|nr:hypothetical protein [Enterobacter bugandensis]
MKSVTKIALATFALTVVGCKSTTERIYECEAQGISRDACYTAEQNRQATLNAAAQKQAYENASAAVNTDTTHKHHQRGY